MRILVSLALLGALIFFVWLADPGKEEENLPLKPVQGKSLMMVTASEKPVPREEAVSETRTRDLPGELVHGVREIGFQDLMNFDPDPLEKLAEEALLGALKEERMKALIPDSIKALNGQKVALEGFIIPINFIGDTTTEFILVVDPMVCCFGQIPRIHEWISVVVEGEPVPLEYVDMPIRVEGILEVGFATDEAGSANLYRMRGLNASIPEDLR